MNFFLTSDVELKFQEKFYWLFNELLVSLGHDVILDKNSDYDVVIYYGNSPEDDIKTISQNESVPVLLIPFVDSFFKNVKTVNTCFGNVIIDAEVESNDLFQTKVNTTKINFDLCRFLFYYLAEEEYVQNKVRDKFARLTFEISKKKDIELEKPIVNIWANWIDKWLVHSLEINNILYFKKCIWPNQAEIAISFSHDIDIVNKSFYRYWKTFIYYLLSKQTSIKNFVTSFFKSIYSSLLKRSTSFTNYQFDRILKFHKSNNIKATFNIISSNSGGLDNENYLKIARADLMKIMNDGHEIGLHGGYESRSYSNQQIFLEEKKILEETIQNEVVSARQHYLGFEFDKTFLVHEKSEIQYDSTIAYPDKAGFKAGFTSPYQPWIFNQNRKANLYELPLILMDGTLLSKSYANMSIMDAKNKFKRFFEIVQKYNGVLTINWHQRIFSEGPYKEWMELYYFMVKYINTHKTFKATQKDILNRYRLVNKVKISLRNDMLIVSSPVEIDSFSFKLNKPGMLKNTNNPDVFTISEKYDTIVEIKKILADEEISIQLNSLNYITC